MVQSIPVTSSLQDYLEAILTLDQEKKQARVTDIADRLGLVKPSVIQALGVSHTAAEKDACLMEHDLSRESFDWLLFFLSRQDIDPELEGEISWNYDQESAK